MTVDPEKAKRAKVHITELVKEFQGVHPFVRDENGQWQCLRHPDCMPAAAMRLSHPDPPIPITDPDTSPLAIVRQAPGGATWAIETTVLADAIEAMNKALVFLARRDQMNAALTDTAPEPSRLYTVVRGAFDNLVEATIATTPEDPPTPPNTPVTPATPASPAAAADSPTIPTTPTQAPGVVPGNVKK